MTYITLHREFIDKEDFRAAEIIGKEFELNGDIYEIFVRPEHISAVEPNWVKATITQEPDRCALLIHGEWIQVTQSYKQVKSLLYEFFRSSSSPQGG